MESLYEEPNVRDGEARSVTPPGRGAPFRRGFRSLADVRAREYDPRNVTPSTGAALVGAYLLGSIPFAYLAVRFRKGIDVRSVGSGNVGATNAGRLLGKGWAIAIYFADAAKGAGAVLAAIALGLEPIWLAACGLLVVLGHVFPVWLRFKGGKGVATITGVFAALVPYALLVSGALWIVVTYTTRFVSLGSIALAVALPIAIVAFDPDGALGDRLPITIMATAVAVLIVVKHVGNVRRIVAGTEDRIGEPEEGA